LLLLELIILLAGASSTPSTLAAADKSARSRVSRCRVLLLLFTATAIASPIVVLAAARMLLLLLFLPAAALPPAAAATAAADDEGVVSSSYDAQSSARLAGTCKFCSAFRSAFKPSSKLGLATSALLLLVLLLLLSSSSGLPDWGLSKRDGCRMRAALLMLPASSCTSSAAPSTADMVAGTCCMLA
jgi:hypothetical protein